jgi:hypothetical protein
MAKMWLHRYYSTQQPVPDVRVIARPRVAKQTREWKKSFAILLWTDHARKLLKLTTAAELPDESPHRD